MTTILQRGGQLIVPIAGWVETPLERARGLLGRSHILDAGAFIICGAKQVHTFGMSRPIDVALCDRDWNVLHVANEMAPNRVGRIVLRGRYAVETDGGTLGELRAGDRLSLLDL